MNHDVKAIYQRYIGFFDGNSANLPRIRPSRRRRYVEYMGGAEQVLGRARADHAAGDDRWVAEVVKHVVFADPDNLDARALLADAFTQLGYQAESGPWRNFYLTGAKELRDGVVVPPGYVSTVTPDVIAAMETGLILDYVAIRLRHIEAADLHTTIELALSDVDERYVLELSNGVLHHRPWTDGTAVDATVTLPRSRLNRLLGEVDADDLLTGDDVEVSGETTAFRSMLGMLDDFAFWFDIVTP